MTVRPDEWWDRSSRFQNGTAPCHWSELKSHRLMQLPRFELQSITPAQRELKYRLDKSTVSHYFLT